jgi:hypothetical protein
VVSGLSGLFYLIKKKRPVHNQVSCILFQY